MGRRVLAMSGWGNAQLASTTAALAQLLDIINAEAHALDNIMILLHFALVNGSLALVTKRLIKGTVAKVESLLATSLICLCIGRDLGRSATSFHR